MTVNDSFSDFQKLLLEKFSFTLVIFGWTLGFIVIYGNVAQILGPEEKVHILWEPLAWAGSLLHLSVIVLIVLSKYLNQKYEDIFTRGKIENPEILYLICLPMLIFNIITMTLTFIKDASHHSYRGSVSLDATAIVYFTAILLLLFHSNGLYDFGEKWIINFLNMITILITIESQIHFIIFYTSFDQVNYFLKILNNTSILNECDNSTNIFCKLWKSQEIFMSKSIVISGFSCSVFLLKPFILHYNHLQRLKKEARNSTEEYIEHVNCTIPIKSIVFSLTISAVLLVTNAILYNEKCKELVIILNCSTEIIIYILMIIFTGFQLNIMKKWPYKSRKKLIFNEILVWVGLCGQLLQSFAMIANCIYLFPIKKQQFQYYLIFFKYVVQIVQNITQSMMESILLEKQMKRPQKENFFLSMSAVIFLAIINLVLGLAEILVHDIIFDCTDMSKFPFNLFSNLIYKTGTVFSIIQRAHGSLLFFRYIRFVKNTK